MKVTNQMIHKDVRLIGSILRIFTAGVTVERYRKHQESAPKKAAKARAKKCVMSHEYLPRSDGSQMRIMILKPKHEVKNVPAVLWFHGGGYIVGYPEEEIAEIENFIEAADCVVLSPDYRLSLEAPYPAALHDAYAALLWLKEHAQELGASSDQIFIIGGSGGGGLTACTALYARDMGEVNVAFQMPMFPMLDDKCNTPSCLDNDAPMCDRDTCVVAWKAYLGDLYGTDDVPCYASPTRAADLSGLPPAYSFVGSIEPLYDETRIYFERLKAAGVEAHLDVYEGGFHGFAKIGANKPLGQEANQKKLAAFQYAVKHYFAPQKPHD